MKKIMPRVGFVLLLLLAVAVALTLSEQQSYQPQTKTLTQNVSADKIAGSSSEEDTSQKAETETSIDKNDEEDDGTYYIGNINTYKFHRPECSYLPDEKNQIELKTIEKAVGYGYSPCLHCMPDQNN